MAPDELREKLWALRLSQVELAALISVTPRAISLWLKGMRKIPGSVDAYLRALEMSPVETRKSEYYRARTILKERK